MNLLFPTKIGTLLRRILFFYKKSLIVHYNTLRQLEIRSLTPNRFQNQTNDRMTVSNTRLQSQPSARVC